MNAVAGRIVDDDGFLPGALCRLENGFSLDAFAAEVHLGVGGIGRCSGNVPPIVSNLVRNGPGASGDRRPVGRRDGRHGAKAIQTLHATFENLFKIGANPLRNMFFNKPGYCSVNTNKQHSLRSFHDFSFYSSTIQGST